MKICLNQTAFQWDAYRSLFWFMGGGSPYRHPLLWTEIPCAEIPWAENPWAETPGSNMGPGTETPRRNMGPGMQTGSDIIETFPPVGRRTWPYAKLRLRAVIKMIQPKFCNRCGNFVKEKLQHQFHKKKQKSGQSDPDFLNKGRKARAKPACAQVGFNLRYLRCKDFTKIVTQGIDYESVF